MLRNEEDSPQGGSQSKVFVGVRFVLLGLDPIEEARVRSKLLSGGGVDVGQYGPSCTHVIADKIVYDDSACVAARSDSKTVVNAFWVDDSFDVGMPVDANSILYRPVKDLNGIPGAKLLSICLTGYRRQDRDDIMRMVSLMGAYFSKPLVANKVTHLICYKFEGEKYELAKKMKKIKLVNERWLEDCLRAWEILPESNYTKSGYELEIMEAEAKDSEEETEEDRDTKQFGMKIVAGGPSNLPSGSGALISERSELPMLVGEVSKIQHNLAELKNLSDITKDIVTDKKFLTSPGKEIGPDLCDVNKKGLEGFAYPGTRAYHGDAISGGLFSPCDQAPTFSKEGSELESNSTTANGSSHSTYSRKTPRRFQGSIFSEAGSSHAHGSFLGHLEQNVKDGFAISPLSYEQGKNNLDFCRIQIPRYESDLNHEEGRTSTLPQKRKAVLSITSSRSPTKGSPNSDTIPEDLLIGASKTKSNLSLCNGSNALDPTDVGNSGDNQSAFLSKANSSDFNNKSLKSGLPISRTMISDSTGFLSDDKMLDIVKVRPSEISSSGLKQFDMITNHDLGNADEMGRSTYLVEKAEEPQKQEKNGEASYSPDTRNSEMGKSSSPVNLGVLKGRKNEASSHTKKTVSKSRLGNRTKLSTGGTNKLKGSLYLDKTVIPNETALSSVENKDGTKHKETSNVKTDIPRPNFKADTVIKERAKGVLGSADRIENKTVCADDDTEAPEEDNDQEVLANAVNKEITEEEKLEGMKHSSNETMKDIGFMNNETAASGEDGAELENAVSGKKSEVGDSTMKLKMTKRGKPFSSKSKKNLVSVMKKIETSGKDIDGVELEKKTDDEKMEVEKENGVQHMASKSKGKSVFVNKSEKPKNVENEEIKNGDLMNGTKHLSCKSKKNPVSVVKELETSGKGKDVVELEKKNNREKKPKSKIISVNKTKKPMDAEKENKPIKNGDLNENLGKRQREEVDVKSNRTPKQINKLVGRTDPYGTKPGGDLNLVRCEPVWFILSGHRLQRKEFQQVIRCLKGRVCRDSHHWSYQATHFIVPDPVRRTEKFFAAAASGRWILKTDYLTASSQAGKFLEEEPYEWFKNGLSEDGAINLEAPRKWRLLRERTGHGAFYGMQIIVYGECIAPPLDTLKRVVKAGDGTILATSPPYTRFLNSGVDFAVVSPSMPRVDSWVQEFLRHEIPCIVADYLVEYVCKPGYSLERHVLYKTHAWAEKSFANLLRRSEEIMEASTSSDNDGSDDVACEVCGSRDRGEVMLICGNEGGSKGCGVGIHIDCCNPQLQAVPEEDWFCPKCSKSKNSTNPAKSTKKRSSLLKS